MDTTVLVIYILVLFSFILRLQLMFMETKNRIKHIEDILLKLVATSENPQQISSFINKADHTNCQQNNRQHNFIRAICHRIEEIIKNASTNNTNC